MGRFCFSQPTSSKPWTGGTTPRILTAVMRNRLRISSARPIMTFAR
jgi:hypothetical protein